MFVVSMNDTPTGCQLTSVLCLLCTDYWCLWCA